MANEVYKKTWWGNFISDSWGSIYKKHIEQSSKIDTDETKKKKNKENTRK